MIFKATFMLLINGITNSWEELIITLLVKPQL